MNDLNNYECENQLDIFDYLKMQETPPERYNEVKLGEIIYFVGYRAYFDCDFSQIINKALGAYKCRVIAINNDTFEACLNNEFVTLKMNDYKTRYYYNREAAEAKRISAFDNDDWEQYDGVYLATRECHKAIKQGKEIV